MSVRCIVAATAPRFSRTHDAALYPRQLREIGARLNVPAGSRPSRCTFWTVAATGSLSPKPRRPSARGGRGAPATYKR